MNPPHSQDENASPRTDCGMILLNFAHPLTPQHVTEIERISRQSLLQVIDIPVQMDHDMPFAPQIRQLVEGIPLESRRWQTEAILINPPAYNYAALTLFAELHGKMGYFPSIVRLRPVKDSAPVRFEVAEIIDLQAVREGAREAR